VMLADGRLESHEVKGFWRAAGALLRNPRGNQVLHSFASCGSQGESDANRRSLPLYCLTFAVGVN